MLQRAPPDRENYLSRCVIPGSTDARRGTDRVQVYLSYVQPQQRQCNIIIKRCKRRRPPKQQHYMIRSLLGNSVSATRQYIESVVCRLLIDIGETVVARPTRKRNWTNSTRTVYFRNL